MAFWVSVSLSLSFSRAFRHELKPLNPSGFSFIYLIVTEYISAARSKGEVLVFPRGRVPPQLKSVDGNDEEKGGATTQVHDDGAESGDEKINIKAQEATFHWVRCYFRSLMVAMTLKPRLPLFRRTSAMTLKSKRTTAGFCPTSMDGSGTFSEGGDPASQR